MKEKYLLETAELLEKNSCFLIAVPRAWRSSCFFDVVLSGTKNASQKRLLYFDPSYHPSKVDDHNEDKTKISVQYSTIFWGVSGGGGRHIVGLVHEL